MNRYCNPPTKATYRSPVYDVRAVPVEKVVANSYNPNVVAPPEMKLLELSIWEDGYTMPCVCYYDAEKDLYELVDGYHRYTVLKTSKRIYKRENGLLPIVVIDKDLSNRMSSTIQKLIDAKVPIVVMDNSNYKTLKKPVRMEYQDDIDIPEFKEIPTYKRMCICILKNDHACKYMGFSPTKEEMSKRSQIMEQYRIIVS